DGKICSRFISVSLSIMARVIRIGARGGPNMRHVSCSQCAIRGGTSPRLELHSQQRNLNPLHSSSTRAMIAFKLQQPFSSRITRVPVMSITLAISHLDDLDRAVAAKSPPTPRVLHAVGLAPGAFRHSFGMSTDAA